ncbi:MAG: DUF692 domain-containing protein [Idiomarina sp.]
MEQVGIGLRRSFVNDALATPSCVGFWELAPENWIPFSNDYKRKLHALKEHAKLTCHGLSLSIGSPDPLDEKFIQQIKGFLDDYQIDIYSEHLSYCSANGHLYDLLPIPFVQEATDYIAQRVRRVQEIIERPLVLENISYYAAPGQQMSELEFINTLLEKSGAQLLLDVNNVFVNSVNHGYDPYAFIAGLPSDRIVYGHIAGHYEEAKDLFIDTHGADVKPEVFNLLRYAYRQHGIFPTVLERDFNIPPLSELCDEARVIEQIQREVSFD